MEARLYRTIKLLPRQARVALESFIKHADYVNAIQALILHFIADSFICVLKEIEMGDDDNAVTASGRAYDHEMQIMSVIPPHPHIVKLIDSFCFGSKYYIAMEYCDKGDLSDYLRRTSAPPLMLEIPEQKIWKFII